MVYENDIVPELDEKLRSDFEKNKESNKQIAELDSKLSNGATYRDAEAYAYEMGEALTKTFKDNLSSETLPDGKMYYNIFMRTVDPMIRETYKDATAAAAKAQANVNEAAGLHVKVKEAVLNDDRLHTMVNILTNNDVQYDDVSWVVEDKTTNIIQSAVDDTMKANADFHAKMGMSPKIVREAEAKCCEWCKDLAGTYEYPLDSDEEMVYHRHANCRCVVEYYPGDGKVQNAHDKTWRNEEAEMRRQERILSDLQGQNYERVKTKGEATTEKRYQNIRVRRVEGLKNEVYISDKANASLRNIKNMDKDMTSAIKAYNGNINNRPRLVVVAPEELRNGVFAKYDEINNTIYAIPQVGDRKAIIPIQKDADGVCANNPKATMYHETWHWMQAEDYRKNIGATTEVDHSSYIEIVEKRSFERLDAKPGMVYNIMQISGYAKEKGEFGRFDEVEAEYQTSKTLKR